MHLPKKEQEPLFLHSPEMNILGAEQAVKGVV